MFCTIFRAIILAALFAPLLHAGNASRHPAPPPSGRDDADWDPTVRTLPGTFTPVPPPSRHGALPPVARRLSLPEAEAYAVANQPGLAASRLRAQAETQRVYEARSQFFPQLQGDIVGVAAKDDSVRLAAIGGITNPTILSRQSDGGLLSQLITDFGHTYFLTTSARANALSAAQRAEATRQTLLFRVDQAYFAAQGAQALLSVSNQNVETNQFLADRTHALFVNALRSNLDLDFAEVGLAQAKLLQIQANARLQESFAELSAALGIGQKTDFTLEPVEAGPAPPDDVGPLIADAWAHRPDLLAARDDRDAALRFAKAQRAAQFPVITAQGGAGISPARKDNLLPESYAAGGININVPVFTGGLLTAREREAFLRAQAAEKLLQDQETEAARDVYTAWTDARAAYQAIGLSEQLVTSAQQAFQLSQARYQAGTSSIVEVSQAELQQIQAQIQGATARFDYQVRRRALDYQRGALR